MPARSNGAGHQIRGCVVALSLEGRDVSLTQAAGSHSIDNYNGGWEEAGLSPVALLGLAARDQGRQW